MKERKKKGEAAFEEYYQNCYQERWIALKQYLLQEEVKFPRPHGVKISHPFEVEKAFAQVKEIAKNNSEIPLYYMDYASFLCAMALPLPLDDLSSEVSEPQEIKVLDMCAAPGGKSLILAQRMQGKGYLELNEYSTPRKQRLLSVLKEFGLELSEHLQVRGYDGLNYGIKRADTFHSILLDAPCSSERHVLKSPQHLNQWTYKRPQVLGKKQYGLVCSALLSLKSQGHLLYSTCALTPLENDDVIERVLEKKSAMCELATIPDQIASLGEATQYGIHFLPDKGPFGPLYMCLLKKK